MGVVSYIRDGLVNAITGMGTWADSRRANAYCIQRLTDPEIDAAFRGSWLMRKIVTKPATEMVREWRDWQADQQQIEKLEAEEKRLNIKGNFWLGEVLRELGGGALVMFVEGDDQATPLDPARIRAGGLTKIHAWHKSRFSIGEPVADWSDPWFGHPSYYDVSLNGATGPTRERFHPSRVIAFRGHLVGGITMTSWEEEWWGDSTVQVVKDAVDNVHTGEDGFAALIKDARNRRIYVPKLLEMCATADGEGQLGKRMAAFAQGESLYGVSWLDGGDAEGKGAERIEDRQMVWSGIPDIKASYMMTAAAAAGIPATVLLEKAPDGMNATGDGDNRNWEKEVKARQDLRTRPCIDQLDTALIPSALGAPDPKVWWIFADLSTPTEKEIAETFKILVEAIDKLMATGLLPQIALEMAVQNLLEERGYLPGLSEALRKLKESERFPSLSAEERPDDETSNGGKEAIEPSAGGGGAAQAPARRAANDARFTDATPRTLYVRRDVVNVAEIKAWAKAQGLPELQDGLHVTLCHIDRAFDWMKVEGEWNQSDTGEITIPPGGVRIVEPLGNRTAVLLFTSAPLSWRHENLVRASGGQDKFPEYHPHFSLTGEPVDLSGVEPYRGKIVLGPEIFEEVHDAAFAAPAST